MCLGDVLCDEAAHGETYDIDVTDVDCLEELDCNGSHLFNREGYFAFRVSNPEAIVDDEFAVLSDGVDEKWIDGVH